MAMTHDARLDFIVNHMSELLGIEDIIVTAKEVNFFKRDNRNLRRQPDGIGISRQGDIYIVEYKCNGTLSHAKKQLNDAEQYIYDNFGLPVRKFYIHGKNYDIEEV